MAQFILFCNSTSTIPASILSMVSGLSLSLSLISLRLNRSFIRVVIVSHSFSSIRYTMFDACPHSTLECRFPLEMHVVHTSSDKNKTAVVGLLYHIGNEEDTFLTEVYTRTLVSQQRYMSKSMSKPNIAI